MRKHAVWNKYFLVFGCRLGGRCCSGLSGALRLAVEWCHFWRWGIALESGMRLFYFLRRWVVVWWDFFWGASWSLLFRLCVCWPAAWCVALALSWAALFGCCLVCFQLLFCCCWPVGCLYIKKKKKIHTHVKRVKLVCRSSHASPK